MLYRVLFILVVGLGLSSCSQPAADLGEGPQVELSFKEAQPDDRKAVVTIVNRSEQDIKKLRGTFIFKDAEGKVVTYANGTPQNSPFSKAQNPNIVSAQTKADIELPLSDMPEGAQTVEVELTEATFADESTFEPK